MVKRTLTAALLAVLAIGEAFADELAWLDAYNVAWSTPSKNSSESMPVGGHDMGLNVWVEDGELLIYLARAGCYDENGALLKLGRLRVNLEPNPFAGDGFFRQERKLREGCVEIRAGRGDAREKILSSLGYSFRGKLRFPRKKSHRKLRHGFSICQRAPAPETSKTFPHAVKSPVRMMVLTFRLRHFRSACGITSTSTPSPNDCATLAK